MKIKRYQIIDIIKKQSLSFVDGNDEERERETCCKSLSGKKNEEAKCVSTYRLSNETIPSFLVRISSHKINAEMSIDIDSTDVVSFQLRK